MAVKNESNRFGILAKEIGRRQKASYSQIEGKIISYQLIKNQIA